MKRSEMITNIKKQLSKRTPHVMVPDKVALALLDIVEELGMRPPIHQFNELITCDTWLNEDGTLPHFIVKETNEA